MKTHEEIHDAIEECKHSLRGPDSAAMWDILHALNDRINALETESSTDFVELNERVRAMDKTLRNVADKYA